MTEQGETQARLDQVLAELGRVRAQVAELENRIEGQATALDDFEELAEKLRSDAERDDDVDAAPIDIEQLARWVHHNVAQLVERKIGKTTDHSPFWCREWWRHPEAVIKFEGLRRAWTELVPQEGVGLITYLSYLDQTVGSLMAENGPFHAGGCRPENGHRAIRTLGDDPLPESVASASEPIPAVL